MNSSVTCEKKQIANATPVDVRLRGFSNHVSLQSALAWVNGQSHQLGHEEVAVKEALGRIPAAALTMAADLPEVTCAAYDGYALQSDETVGANNYNPVAFTLSLEPPACASLHAKLVTAGSPLPAGADAVLPFESAESSGSIIEVSASVAAGTGVIRQGEEIRNRAIILNADHPLQPHDIGLLALCGITSVRVLHRPRVALIIAATSKQKPNTANDANGPMLAELIARDGGISECVQYVSCEAEALASLFRASEADVILCVGRTGTGPDDIAPLALAAAGEVNIHGVAMRPGGSVALGHIGQKPVALLPGRPIAAFCAYERLAGPMIRRLAGRSSSLPYLVEEVELGAKIVSEVGMSDFCLLRLIDGLALPIASPESSNLASLVNADGFILVPSSSEGYPAGARVALHRLCQCCS